VMLRSFKRALIVPDMDSSNTIARLRMIKVVMRTARARKKKGDANYRVSSRL